MIPCAPYHRNDPPVIPGDFSLPGMMNPAVCRTASGLHDFAVYPLSPAPAPASPLYNKKVWPSRSYLFLFYSVVPGIAPEQSRCPAVVLLPPPEGFLRSICQRRPRRPGSPLPAPRREVRQGAVPCARPPFHRRQCRLRSGQSPAWFLPPYRSCSGSPLSLSTHRETPSVVMRISPSRSVR